MTYPKIEKIKVSMPRLDGHDNNLVVDVILDKSVEIKGKHIIGFTIGDSTSRDCDRNITLILQEVFEEEFNQLQQKYIELIKKAISILDIRDLNKYSSNLYIAKDNVEKSGIKIEIC